MTLKYIAGEDLKAGQVVQLNEEDGKIYRLHVTEFPDLLITVRQDVKKDQVIKKEKQRD